MKPRRPAPVRSAKNAKEIGIVLLIVAVLGGVAVWDEFASGDIASPEIQFELPKMSMPQATKHCRTLWTASRYDQAPLAVAWHRQGVEWYVLDGADTASMRHYRCDGNTVTKGQRYERPMADRLPVEENARYLVGDRNLFDLLATITDPDLQAIEAADEPRAHGAQVRTWKAGTATTQGADAANLPSLFTQVPAELAGKTGAPLKPMAGHANWLKQPAAVFALLAKVLPPGTRIAELDVDDKNIRVIINGPIKNFDNKSPADFGDTNFDEYGIRDNSWWYPREQVGTSCTPGHTLDDIAKQFERAPNRERTDLYRATFNCQAKGTLAPEGSWILRVPRRPSSS